MVKGMGNWEIMLMPFLPGEFGMKMPETIEPAIVAPCGINCIAWIV